MSESASVSHDGERISAVVKWFNPIKGFGFVQPNDGSGDAFVHVSVLEAAGHRDLPDGAAVECEIAPGEKGPMVTVIHSVAAPTAGAAPAAEPEGPPLEGTVKFFDANKGYGFIVPDNGGQDIFVSGRVVARSGLRMLDADARVRVGIRKGDKGPLAVSVELLN